MSRILLRFVGTLLFFFMSMSLADEVAAQAEFPWTIKVEEITTDLGCPDGLADRSSDLCAQWQAADAAKDSALWTERSFYLGLTGAGIAFLTFLAAVAAAMFARKAAMEAAKSAAAANDAVRTSRLLGEAQIRAYLFCKSARYEVRRDRITAFLDIGNAGVSPATNVKIAGELTIQEVLGEPNHPRVALFVTSDEFESQAQPIGPGGSVTEDVTVFRDFSYSSEQTEEERDFLFEHGNTLWFSLKISWFDVFGFEHEFDLDLDAEIGPSPSNRMKERSRNGKLKLRAKDALTHTK